MEHQQSFSSGLLYSVSPADFPQLHLNDESNPNEFDWNESRTQAGDSNYTQAVLAFLKLTATKWRLIRK